MGLIPDWGNKIPHTAEQLSPSAASTEPNCFGACRPQLETRATQGKIPHDATKA